MNNQERDEMIMKIAGAVAMKSRIEDKEEAHSIALLGIVKGLNSYDPKRNAKLSTYLYSCAKYEVWTEWRKQNRLKRGKNYTTVSLTELAEKGIEPSVEHNLY